MKNHLPFELKRRYKKGINGILDRKMRELGIFRKGYFVYSEADVKEYNSGKGCLLALIFLPLALFGRSKYIEVTYRLSQE